MAETLLRQITGVRPHATAGDMLSGDGGSSTFPSLLIRADELQARGAFAETQAAFLEPDRRTVAALGRELARTDTGVVAHFYMDAELQGVLTACDWPHIHISDSLAMADRAIAMVEAGVRHIVVLGVDFMSENVRAMLDAAGHAEVPVYRVARDPIGCSLAEAAEAEGYTAWLEEAAASGPALHVVYINTSLATKARAHAIVPTITCTSSNVVRTLLTAAEQVPETGLWYGPDTYMGENLRTMFETMRTMDDEAVRRVHPDHDAATLGEVLSRYHHYEEGACIVHHMFGEDVVRRVRRDHPDAYVTAHLEVPGEMFALGFQAQAEGRGVVGSTSDILGFIRDKVHEADENPASAHRLSFVLGTEAGMITAIVRKVQDELRARDDAAGRALEAEIIFPVATEAIAQTGEESLRVVPGVASGEGCSVAGGCATCPFMKMNSLDALEDLLARIERDEAAALGPFRPKTYDDTIAGRTVADLGSEPILHMRAFQKTGRLSADLVADIRERARRT